MIKKYLLAPGPTPVPESVLLAMAQPIFHHRTPQLRRSRFAKSLRDSSDHPRRLMLAPSGSAPEAAITTTTCPATVLVVNGGVGERWGKISRHGPRDQEPGSVGPPGRPGRGREGVEGASWTKLNLMQGSPVTTVLHPIARSRRSPAGPTRGWSSTVITASALDLPMDALGITAATGSRSVDRPGRAFIAPSEKRGRRGRSARASTLIWRERDNQQKHTTAGRQRLAGSSVCT